MTEHIECIFFEVKSQCKKHKKKTLVGVVYRPPNTNFNAFTEQIINIIHTLQILNKQCYININLLHYDLGMMFMHLKIPEKVILHF